MSKSYKVLIVDDEAVVVSSAERVLATEGFSVVTAGDAEKALEMMPEVTPAIVIVDLKLPGISGIDFLKVVRRQFPEVIVIVVTGYTNVENALTSIQQGAFDFLPKPFAYDELLSPVSRACRFLESVKPRLEAARQAVPRDCHFLGFHSWAKPEANGRVEMGVSPIFLETVGKITSVSLPELNQPIQQGGRFLRITDDEDLIHTVWSPLSGRVLEVNQAWRQDVQAPDRTAAASGWIIRLDPVDLEGELPNLNKG